MSEMVTVVGAGLAGCEAAWQLAQRGISVRLCEMKPVQHTPAHHSDDFAELVCSNSLRSDELTNAVGLLKEELRRLGSIVMRCADEHRVAAGGALAVENPFIAKARLQQMMMGFAPPLPPNDCPREDMRWEKTPTASSALRLDKDVSVAMEKMEQIRRITESLPGIDCGACGSPKCRAFAEDIVAGRAEADMCVFSDKNDKDK